MSKIKLTVEEPIVDGKIISFKPKINSSQVTGLIINDVEYDIVDSIGTSILGRSVWNYRTVVSVILNTSHKLAFIQNQIPTPDISIEELGRVKGISFPTTLKTVCSQLFGYHCRQELATQGQKSFFVEGELPEYESATLEICGGVYFKTITLKTESGKVYTRTWDTNGPGADNDILSEWSKVSLDVIEDISNNFIANAYVKSTGPSGCSISVYKQGNIITGTITTPRESTNENNNVLFDLNPVYKPKRGYLYFNVNYIDDSSGTTKYSPANYAVLFDSFNQIYFIHPDSDDTKSIGFNFTYACN